MTDMLGKMLTNVLMLRLMFVLLQLISMKMWKAHDQLQDLFAPILMSPMSLTKHGPKVNPACLEGPEGEGKNCLNIDECLVDGDNTCHAQATCDNFFERSKYELGYTCTCPDYLVGDGHACANIDECSNNLNNCGDNTNCKDNDNEVSGQIDFTCSHIDGYECETSVTDRFTCKNIDEDATDADNCAEEGSSRCILNKIMLVWTNFVLFKKQNPKW